MKLGRTLQDMSAELQRQLDLKRDFTADTRQLNMSLTGKLHIAGIELDPREINRYAHSQIASGIQIPFKYYDRMRTESPILLAQNVNHWFEKEPKKHLIRTVDGRVRAMLSDRYRTLDNYDLAEIAISEIQKQKCKVVSCEVTESRMYIKVIAEEIQTEVSVGDVVQSGIVISNSEVGAGSVRIEPLVYRLVCDNGMIANDSAIRKYHVGRGSLGDEDNASEFFKDETRVADDKAFWLKVRDVIQATLQVSTFERIVERMRISKNQIITGDLQKVVEVTSNRLQLNRDETDGVLKHLINGGDLSQYGLVNALTRTSQDIKSYDRATDFERFGGNILDLDQQQWQLVNSN